jgi:hypothetical protein
MEKGVMDALMNDKMERRRNREEWEATGNGVDSR